jgi:hypothetical protein
MTESVIGSHKMVWLVTLRSLRQLHDWQESCVLATLCCTRQMQDACHE